MNVYLAQNTIFMIFLIRMFNHKLTPTCTENCIIFTCNNPHLKKNYIDKSRAMKLCCVSFFYLILIKRMFATIACREWCMIKFKRCNKIIKPETKVKFYLIKIKIMFNYHL